ncbi:MAG: FadR family transcriptional regulator [Chloroflexi bacterium]|nr:FadR family transcriptional regulator [Chloroflexota bacterium]
MYSTIQLSRLYEQIVKQIQNRMAEGLLHPGEQLPSERELAIQFGVSRTAVREAVKALREKGLVEIRPGRGTFVTDIAASTSGVVRDSLSLMLRSGLSNGLADLVQVRTMLEPEIAAIAAAMASEEDIWTLQKAVEIMDRAFDNAVVFVEADLEFHLALAKATQNRLIPVLIDPIMDLLREQRMRIFQVRGGPGRGQYHHKQILKAVSQRNAEAARKAMAAHLQQVRDDSAMASRTPVASG